MAGVVLVALYQDDELVGVATENIATATTDFAVTAKSISASKTPYRYRIFFWNNLRGLIPLCESISGDVW